MAHATKAPKLLKSECRQPERLKPAYAFLRRRLAQGCKPEFSTARSVWVGEPTRFTVRGWLAFPAEQDGRILPGFDSEAFVEELRRYLAAAGGDMQPTTEPSL